MIRQFLGKPDALDSHARHRKSTIHRYSVSRVLAAEHTEAWQQRRALGERRSRRTMEVAHRRVGTMALWAYTVPVEVPEHLRPAPDFTLSDLRGLASARHKAYVPTGERMEVPDDALARADRQLLALLRDASIPPDIYRKTKASRKADGRAGRLVRDRVLGAIATVWPQLAAACARELAGPFGHHAGAGIGYPHSGQRAIARRVPPARRRPLTLRRRHLPSDDTVRWFPSLESEPGYDPSFYDLTARTPAVE